MTVSNLETRKRYNGTGGLLIFPYTWKIYAATDLNVWLTDLNGIHVQQTLNVDYTVSGVGVTSGGNVTFVVAPAATSFVTISCDLPLTQETDYVELDAFPAQSHEDALDRLVKISQQLYGAFWRVPLLPEASPVTSLPLPENLTGLPTYLRWNAGGTALETSPTTPAGTNFALEWIDVRDYTTLAAAIAANPGGGTLYFAPITWPVAANLTIPSNFTNKIDRGAIFSVANDVTLTINGALDAGPYQIFSCTGTGKVVFAAGTTVYSSWFADIATALTGIGAIKTRLIITKSETIATDLTINAATTLVGLPGNILSVDVDKTLTINGPLEAGAYQIFDGLGTVVYGGLVYMKYGEWSAGSGINIVLTTGDQTVAGVKTFSSFPVTPSSAPTTDYQVTNKKYVDDTIPSMVSMAILQNRQNQNTGGGDTTAGSWLIVPLNTEYEDPDSIVDATSLPAFSLAAGTYRIEARCPFYASDLTQTRLYNVTDGAVQQNIHALDILGTSEWAYPTDDASCNSKIEGTFTIVAIKQFRIEYQTAATTATTGHGRPCNYGVEVYAQVKITKLD